MLCLEQGPCALVVISEPVMIFGTEDGPVLSAVRASLSSFVSSNPKCPFEFLQ
jgi:hypothetical protein